MLLTLLAAAPAAVTAQEPSPSPGSLSFPPVLIAWLDAFGVGDPQAFAALYTEDGLMEDVPNGVVATGHEEIAEAIAATFATVSESEAVPIGGFQAGDMVAMEYQVNAISADGVTPISFRGVVIAQLEGDLLKRTTEYFDTLTILGQIGMTVVPASEAGTPTP
jgi:uncharacterized protein (TIGR02246 family)